MIGMKSLLHNKTQDKQALKFKDQDKLKSESLDTSFRRAPRGGIEEEKQQLLQSHIEGIILAPMLDHWIWSYEALSEFSMKSVRNFIDDALLPEQNVATRWVNIIIFLLRSTSLLGEFDWTIFLPG
ncbi:hypothetical protein Tco_0051557 [Tanacetum coccineum]